MPAEPEPIASAFLRGDDVPQPGAEWWPEVSRFALTFSGYWYFGSLDACAAVARSAFGAYRATRRLPSGLSLDAVRACLFFEQRRFRHAEETPEGEARDYIDLLLSTIRGRAESRRPQRAGHYVERRAFEVIWAEELAKGRHPRRLSKTQEAIEGCDLLSYPDEVQAGEPERIEIKGWGESLLGPDGAFQFDADVNREQHARATESGATWRLEIVANLSATANGPLERLSLSAGEVINRAAPWKWSVPLGGLEHRIARARE